MICRNIVFPRASLFILGLVFSRGLVDYVVTSVFMSYLTNNYWQIQNLRKAAAIINLQVGVTMFMEILFAHISDACTGRFRMVAISTAPYIIGLVLLLVGDRTLEEDESPVPTLFYVALLLIALGTAVLQTPLREFLADQLRNPTTEPITDTTIPDERIPDETIPDEPIPDEIKVDAIVKVWWRISWFSDEPIPDERKVDAIVKVWWRISRFSGASLATFTLSRNDIWAYKFKISVITMGVGYLLFLFAFSFYNHNREEAGGSPLSLLYRVPKAAILKRDLDYTGSPSQFHQNDNNDQPPFFPQDQCLSWLDKAAILRASALSTPEEQFDQRKVFAVRQVREVKLLLTMFPMWTTFLAYSLVESTGYTFFIEQSTNLNDQIGNGFTVSINVFFLMKSCLSFIFANLCDSLIQKFPDRGTRHHCTLVTIGFGLVCCILCCITAMQVEIRRLHLVKIKGVENYPEYTTIPMSIFWLTPQYCLLGVMEGLTEQGLLNFVSYQLTHKRPDYRIYWLGFIWVLGIGKFINAAFLFIFKSWFGPTINESRLDHYYKMLVFLCVANLLVYICVSCMYYSKRVPVENSGVVQGMEGRSATLEEDGTSLGEQLCTEINLGD